MDIKKIVEGKIIAPKEGLVNDIAYIEKVLKRKGEIKNNAPNLTRPEKALLEFNPKMDKVPLKTFRNPKSEKLSWMKFLKEDEMKKLVTLSPSDALYQRIRSNCYNRKYYSDPENLKMQYQRNKQYRESKKIVEKKELEENIHALLVERKKKEDEQRLLSNEYSRQRYHRIKNDPEFKEKEKENNRKYREEHKNYRKINAVLRKEGAIPLSTKGLLRKELIRTKLLGYKTAIDFKKEHLKDYNWIRTNGVIDELLGHFPDYVKRKKYKAEKEDAKDEVTAKLRKAKRNASKCYSLREFKRRFPASYEYCLEMKIEAEIISLFKIILS